MVEYEGLARFVNADALRVSDARKDQDHELEDLVIYGFFFCTPANGYYFASMSAP